jgi:hypothetical protein
LRYVKATDFGNRGHGRFVRWQPWCSCLALDCLASTLLRAASENPLYTVTGIEVDVSAETAAEAKKQAITEANVKAFRVFAERVGADAATLDEISRIPSKQIDAMLNSLSIEEERTGPGRYIGKLTVRFLPRPAKALMNRLGVQYSEKVAGKTVVIPLWKAPDGTLQVWEDNPWRQAWLSLRAENSLVPVLVPLGDLTDTGLLTAEQAAANDEGSLEAIRLRYEAEAVLVAVAEPLGEDTVQATMVGDSPVGKLGFDKGYTAEQGGGLTEAAQIAAARFHEVMQLRWKKMNEPGLSHGPCRWQPCRLLSPSSPTMSGRRCARAFWPRRACRALTSRPFRKVALLFSCPM